MNQTEIADKAKTSKEHLSRILTGKVEPKVGMALRIAKYLGKPVEDVWTEDGAIKETQA